MKIPYITLSEVVHVGHLDAETRTSRSSMEAFMLSVSVDPDEWSSIARTGGKTWTLSLPDAQYVDAMSLVDDDMADIFAWAQDQGYLEQGTIWRVWMFMDESDDYGYMEFDSEEAALREVDEDLEDDFPSSTGEQLEEIESFLLTEKGMNALERWQQNTDATNGAIILWAREVAAKDNPNCVGVWWNEDYSPESLSCPRGGIFPERLSLFDIQDETGNAPENLWKADKSTEDLSL